MGLVQRVLSLDRTGPAVWDENAAYFIVQTTTPGTGIAGHAAPVQADLATKPLIHLFNNGPREIIIDYIKVRMTAIGAGATTTDFEAWTDYPTSGTPATTRTGGGTLVSPALNTSSHSPLGSAAVVYFGAVTATSVNAKRIGHSRVRSVVPVAEDQYLFSFGQNILVPNAGMATTGTNQLVAFVPMAPVAIGPLANFQFSEWGASQSGAHSFDLELGYWERVI